MKIRLKELDAQIEGLLPKADKATAEAKSEYKERLGALRTKRETARATLEELEAASEEAWEDLKAGVDVALGELKNAVASAVSRFE